jgi:type I restriction enzyme, S subunit
MANDLVEIRVIDSDIPKHWGRSTFRKLIQDGDLELIQDGNHGGAYPKTSEFDTCGIPLITGADLSEGNIDLSGCKFLKPASAAKLRIGFAKQGDVLLSHKGTMGKTALVPKLAWPYIILNPQLTLYRVSADGRIDRRFLKFFFSGRPFQAFLERISGISTISSLSLSVQKSLEIPIPPLAEQKSIARILGALDDKIELNLKMNATLEAMARTLYKSWFVDFDPVKRNAECGFSKPEDSMFPNSFEDSLLGDIPSEWNVTTLGDVLDVLETGRRPKGGVAGYSSGIPSIGAESIWGIGKFDYSKTKYVPTEFYEKTSAGRVEHNDVLLYKDGGKPGEFRPRVGLFGHGFPFEKFSINEHVFRMRSGSVGQMFLYFAVSDQRVLDDFANKGGKAAIPGINQVDVRSARILMPDKRVLEEFNRQVTPWCDLMIQNAIQSRTLSNLRDALLPKLLSGEICLKK